VKLKEDFEKEIKYKDNLIEKVIFSQTGDGVIAQINLKYPLPSDKYDFFSLNNPDRLVIDFHRDFEEKSLTCISPGIVWTSIVKGNASGRTIINMVEIDLSRDDVYIKAVQAEDNNHSRESTSSVADRTDALIALNGGFYHVSGGPLGLVVVDGDIESIPVNTRPPRSVLGITEDENILIDIVDVVNDRLSPFSNEDWQKITYAIGGGPNLITDSKMNFTAKKEELGPNGNDVTKRDSHTVVGITEDNKLIFFTVDGRKLSYSRGMSLEQIAKFLLSEGLKEAMCMDGGNSTALVIEGHLVSNTFDKERKVANCWAVFTEDILTSPASIDIVKKDFNGLTCLLEFSITDSSSTSVPDGTGVRFRTSSGLINPSFTSTSDGLVSVEVSSIKKEEVRLVITSGTVEKDFYLNF